ncbi:MAG: hypothetical protein E2O79_09945 [Caldithrix sp.]|nr:MAG: hypothetical protein E2O79_09945 [Caldithrix sp.]
MKVVERKYTVEQKEDCCGRAGHDDQYLIIETHDGGGGEYFVIETERWAIDDIDIFCADLKKIFGKPKKEKSQ